MATIEPAEIPAEQSASAAMDACPAMRMVVVVVQCWSEVLVSESHSCSAATNCWKSSRSSERLLDEREESASPERAFAVTGLEELHGQVGFAGGRNTHWVAPFCYLGVHLLVTLIAAVVAAAALIVVVAPAAGPESVAVAVALAAAAVVVVGSAVDSSETCNAAPTPNSGLEGSPHPCQQRLEEP